jgi:hypothetical protein
VTLGLARLRRAVGIYADADRPPWPRLLRRIADDIDFLTWLRVASLGELRAYRLHWASLPKWRRVALTRAINKALAKEQG